MRVASALLVVVLALGGARAVREAAAHERARVEVIEDPFTPSPRLAPLLSLGYRELAADLVYIRLRVYFGAYYDVSAPRVAALAESVAALDPRFKHIYVYGANAMTIAPVGADQSIYRRAVALLERGITEFPWDWQLPLLAGQMYIQDLRTDDPAQRRTWDERGTLLVESAIRKPGAPLQSATWAARLRTKLGQRERAIEGLHELLLVTNDKRAREGLLNALAKLKERDKDEIASEIFEERKRFEQRWKAERPAVDDSTYLLLGPPLPRAFDLADLATGGRDFIGSEGIERLEPLYEDVTSAGGPSSP